MVNGLEKFKEWFKDTKEQYVIIGGTACDILMEEAGLEFRATKDIDLVIIIEALTPDFGKKLWQFIEEGCYEHRNASLQTPQFYKFSKPKSKEYPAMLELFTRKLDKINLPKNAILTPLPMEEDISSLSAILLNDDYYEFLKRGIISENDVSILNAEYLIPFKAKAWIDLTNSKNNGCLIDSKNIKKHKNDIFRLSQLIRIGDKIPLTINIYNDIQHFISQMIDEDVDLKQLGLINQNKEDVLEKIKNLYFLNENKDWARILKIKINSPFTFLNIYLNTFLKIGLFHFQNVIHI